MLLNEFDEFDLFVVELFQIHVYPCDNSLSGIESPF